MLIVTGDKGFDTGEDGIDPFTSGGVMAPRPVKNSEITDP
jgi:hypothetical protein